MSMFAVTTTQQRALTYHSLFEHDFYNVNTKNMNDHKTESFHYLWKHSWNAIFNQIMYMCLRV